MDGVRTRRLRYLDFIKFLNIASFEISNFNSDFIFGLFDSSYSPSGSYNHDKKYLIVSVKEHIPFLSTSCK